MCGIEIRTIKVKQPNYGNYVRLLGTVEVRLRLSDNLARELPVSLMRNDLYSNGLFKLRVEPTLQKVRDGVFLRVAFDQQDELHDMVSNSCDR